MEEEYIGCRPRPRDWRDYGGSAGSHCGRNRGGCPSYVETLAWSDEDWRRRLKKTTGCIGCQGPDIPRLPSSAAISAPMRETKALHVVLGCSSLGSTEVGVLVGCC